MARDYKKEYKEYHGKDEQKKRRAGRNNARRKMERSGVVSKGDGQDVHHRDGNPKNNASHNIVATTRKANRGKLRMRRK